MDSIRLDATVFWCIGTWPTNPGLPGTSCSKGSARAPGPCIYIPWLWWANIKTTERVLGGNDRETNPDLCGSCSGWSSTAGQVHRLSRWANVQIMFSIELYWVVSCSNDTCLAAGCHRCTCPTKEFLNPYKTWPSKTTEKMKKEVFRFAAGGGKFGDRGSVVDFTDDGQTRAGPSSSNYESRRACAGAHLMFNAFWMISSFCIYQMYMRDSLHQVDHGIIIHILRAILRLFQGY